jgi:hypothetical protein
MELIERQDNKSIVPAALLQPIPIYSPRATIDLDYQNNRCIPDCDVSCEVCMKSLECTKCKIPLKLSMRNKTKCITFPTQYLRVDSTNKREGPNEAKFDIEVIFDLNQKLD